MKYLPLILVAVILLAISCQKNNRVNIIPPGTYTGTFERSIMNKISNLTLHFSTNNFEGQSQYVHYPDLCKGSFSTDNATASFENSCVYTADFDWTYILSGKFEISTFGDSLKIFRSYNGFVLIYDTYKLKRQ